MPFQGDAPEGSDSFQWPVIERECLGGLRLIIWDKMKVPLCHYRVMHRKRMTCELYDSYFRLMTIKHSISKIEWAIVWAIVELLYNAVKTKVRWQLEFDGKWQLSWRRSRRDVVGKTTSGGRGLWALMNWGPEKMLIRCSKESQHPAEWTPRPPVEHQEKRTTTLTAMSVEVKILKFLFGLQLPLTRKP